MTKEETNRTITNLECLKISIHDELEELFPENLTKDDLEIYSTLLKDIASAANKAIDSLNINNFNIRWSKSYQGPIWVYKTLVEDKLEK